jgi:hypothetical protein
MWNVLKDIWINNDLQNIPHKAKIWLKRTTLQKGVNYNNMINPIGEQRVLWLEEYVRIILYMVYLPTHCHKTMFDFEVSFVDHCLSICPFCALHCVLLRSTVSDYPFVIFKLFKQTLNPDTTSPEITPIKKSNSKYATESVI